MKITITDIARDTGLAVSTISKYLNHKNILPENEALVEASIKKLGPPGIYSHRKKAEPYEFLYFRRRKRPALLCKNQR